MYSTLLCGCAKFHTMFVSYFFVLSVMCMWAMHIVYCVLLILTTVVLYCMDLIACCNPASILTSSISSPVFTDNGSVKLCMNVNVLHICVLSVPSLISVTLFCWSFCVVFSSNQWLFVYTQNQSCCFSCVSHTFTTVTVTVSCCSSGI